MKKIIIPVLVIALVFVSGCIGPLAKTTEEPLTPIAEKDTTGEVEIELAEVVNEVSIMDFAFNPETLTIKVGTTVAWTNEDSVLHDVMNNAESNLEMGELFDIDLEAGESGSYTFTEVGEYNYHCHIHPSMTGKIVVEE